MVSLTKPKNYEINATLLIFHYTNHGTFWCVEFDLFPSGHESLLGNLMLEQRVGNCKSLDSMRENGQVLTEARLELVLVVWVPLTHPASHHEAGMK